MEQLKLKRKREAPDSQRMNDPSIHPYHYRHQQIQSKNEPTNTIMNHNEAIFIAFLCTFHHPYISYSWLSFLLLFKLSLIFDLKSFILVKSWKLFSPSTIYFRLIWLYFLATVEPLTGVPTPTLTLRFSSYYSLKIGPFQVLGRKSRFLVLLPTLKLEGRLNNLTDNLSFF